MGRVVVDISDEKKQAFQIKCITQKTTMSSVISCMVDDVLDEKWDKWEYCRSRR